MGTRTRAQIRAHQTNHLFASITTNNRARISRSMIVMERWTMNMNMASYNNSIIFIAWKNGFAYDWPSHHKRRLHFLDTMKFFSPSSIVFIRILDFQNIRMHGFLHSCFLWMNETMTKNFAFLSNTMYYFTLHMHIQLTNIELRPFNRRCTVRVDTVVWDCASLTINFSGGPCIYSYSEVVMVNCFMGSGRLPSLLFGNQFCAHSTLWFDSKLNK